MRNITNIFLLMHKDHSIHLNRWINKKDHSLTRKHKKYLTKKNVEYIMANLRLQYRIRVRQLAHVHKKC